MKVERGGISTVKIESVDVRGGGIITPYGLAVNAFAQLTNLVGGRPRKFEEDREFNKAVLVGFNNGVVEKGEVLGLVCVTNGSEKGNRRKLQFSQKSGKGVVKTINEFQSKPLRIGRKGEWKPAISAENRKLRRGVAEIIKIRPIEVSDYAVVNPLGIMRQAYGTMIGGVSREPWNLEGRKTVEEVVFLPIMDGEIKEDQLIGVFNVTRVAESKL